MRPGVLLETIQTASAILEVRGVSVCISPMIFSIPAVSALTHDIAGIANASLDLLRGTTVRTKMVSPFDCRCIVSKQLSSCSNLSFAVTTPTPVARGAVSDNFGKLGCGQLIKPFNGVGVWQCKLAVICLPCCLSAIVEQSLRDL
jgi:hypothetical protein